MTTGTLVSRKETKTKNGKPIVYANIDGVDYGSFDLALNGTIMGTGNGSIVEFEYVQNGSYKNLSAFRATGKVITSAPTPDQGNPVPSGSSTTRGRDYATEEFQRRVSMTVSYAKDLVVAGKAADLKEGISKVFVAWKEAEQLWGELAAMKDPT